MIRAICIAAMVMLNCASALAHDGQDNHYKLSISDDAKRAHIEANVWIEGNELVLFGVNPTAKLKNGQGDLLEKIQARDNAGQAIALKDKGEGEYELAGSRRIQLSYDVRLEHDQHEWPGGTEEVSYRTPEGLMATGYALFLVPGVKMLGKTRVDFTLPKGWVARTPWRALEQGNSFMVESRRELVNNALFFGTARAEQFRSGGIDLTLVMGARYWPQLANFKELIERQLKTYLEMFGKPPAAQRYLIVINQGDTGDGGAFSGSFSQYLKGNGELATRAIWGRVIAHELLHFWNGISMAPVDGNEEWFKEGVTDYLTIASMARNGLIDRDYLLQNLENLPRGQLVARRLMGLKGSVRAAHQDKHRNWLLVYGGGTIAALAADIELRRATDGKIGLPDLMKAMFAEFGTPGKGYTQADIVRVGKRISSVDLGPLLDRLVGTESMPDLAPLFASLGMQLEQYGMLETYLLRKPDAVPGAHKMFMDIFGMAY